MPNDFQDFLQNPQQQPPKLKPTNEQIVKEIEADNEKDYYKELKKKNKNYLIDLSLLERERIAKHIKNLFDDTKDIQKELSDKYDEYDDTYRMVRKQVTGADESMPNYTTPLSTVTLEVIHANILNVFFTPRDIMRVIPTEESDIPKVNKLSIFGNWSLENEINIFIYVDRLFHSSTKNGECPYIVHWVKEYGIEIKRDIVMNPADPTQPLIDPDTQQSIYQEREEPKLLYNGPKLEVFSRKDYFQPKNAIMDKLPPWEGRRIRLTYDDYLKDELQGKMYGNSIRDILDWSGEGETDIDKIDYEGNIIPIGKFEKEFREWYGRLRINIVKRDKEGRIEEEQELEDEFIAIINLESEVLCSLRKNKFPLKERPIGVDYFIPDDEGRRSAQGVMEFMSGPQKAYDALFNQYILGVVQANNPFGFFSPMGNQKNEPIKIQNGYLFPTADPTSINIVKLPPPDNSMQLLMELVSYWAQMLFGTSDYSAGLESKIDPSAPAKKAEIVVAQGSVRLNAFIKRKNYTLKNIFRKWFLLYKDNMPANKFMRIAGTSEDNPWKFEAVSLQDFALNSIPDFELTGNILNVNKQFEANKRIAIYQLVKTNPFFMPNTRSGLMALHGLTKWLIDGLEETGLSRLLPAIPGEIVHTPEEENARFLQGDYGKPVQGEPHLQHLKVHQSLILDPTIPDEIKQKIIIPHIQETIKIMQEEFTQQAAMAQMGINPQQMRTMNPEQMTGGMNAVREGTPAGARTSSPDEFQLTGMGRY